MRLAGKVTAGVLILDQVSKYIVLQWLHLERVREFPVFPPFLNFVMAKNRGVNFGLLSGDTDWMRWVLIIVALAISLWVWVWIAREPHSRRVNISAGLLVGGALGNVVDRLVHGAVIDFLNMSLPGWQNPYSFNVADVAIFLGAVGLVLFTGKDHRANDG